MNGSLNNNTCVYWCGIFIESTSFTFRERLHQNALDVYIVLPLEIQLSRGRVRIPLTGLTLPHVCAVPGSKFLASYVVFLCVFSIKSRWEVIVCFIEHHKLSFHNVNKRNSNNTFIQKLNKNIFKTFLLHKTNVSISSHLSSSILHHHFANPPPPPLKLEKIRFFGVKSWFFTRNTPKKFASPSARCNFFKCAHPL